MIERIDGGGVSQFRDVIKQLGHNVEVDIEYATILAPPPALRVQIDNMKIELDADDVIVPEHLREHTRKISVKATIPTTLELNRYTRVTKETESSAPVNSKAFSDVFNFGGFTSGEFEITFHDTLKAGDRVAVASFGAGQRYIVLDRIGGAADGA
ncbi:DUF2577 domain-containing protein [Paenibacillus polymyxa]|uniref:DUF2577 domain-containing protein n=1 Tax=Paenibacillus TaxID=44249 RepID=UPI00142DC396|nr:MULTISPECIES: DUF2577 domain-containing protein [Paenibacillus]KAF6658859.1 DUF2577 domain-containing protein [Paenibacillus sp. EKM301P]UBS85388.1 DUF2577 domain-containing protein [Paenibacillus polymyxa]WHX33904.1 DUF2577 domain-containing protein [Paenibacillus polymyxa]